MKNITVDVKLVAACGLYCGSCGRYLKEKCPGCGENEKAGWCKVRSCCRERGFRSCADCGEFSNVMECGYYNNFMAKLFGFIFRSDRSRCISRIKSGGYDGYAKFMADNKLQSIKR